MSSRIAIIGCGAVSELLHLPTLKKIKWIPSMLVDINEERLLKIAKKYNIPEVSTDYKNVLDQFDAAIVALPHSLHEEVCCNLLEANKHVFVEKPIATSSEECTRINSTAASSDGTLTVGLFRRYLQGAHWLKKALENNLLGDIKGFDVREGDPYDWPVASDSFWRKETACGGVLIDTGAHTLDLVTWWLGDALEVDYRDDANGGVEADCFMRLIMSSRATGVVELSRTRSLRNTVIIEGSKGRIESHVRLNQIKAEPDNLLDINFDGISAKKLPAKGTKALFVDQLADWRRVVLGEKEPYVNGYEGARSITLIEKCYRERKGLDLPGVKTEKDQIPSPGIEGLKGKNILVTGATGFIGGRLVEKLILDYKITPKVLVRDYAKVARIARFPVEIKKSDLSDRSGLEKALEGCDIVFHCAFDFSASLDDNVSAIKVLAETCRSKRINRLVHVSTISVYEPLKDGDVTEESKSEPVGISYADTKLAVEEEILRQVLKYDLPAVVIQPTNVYGSFGRTWTDKIVEKIQRGTIVLPDGGEGLCNAVYVDDVVNAMILASIRNGVVGERFLISGAEPVTWDMFYGKFADAVGASQEAVVCKTTDEIRRLNRNPLTKIRLLISDPAVIAKVGWFQPIITINDRVVQFLKDTYIAYMKKAPKAVYIPDSEELTFLNSKAHVRIDKARRLLGYEPVFDFEHGMEMTGEYIKWAFCGDNVK